MKRFLKRTLAVLMTLVMLIGIAPVAGLTNLLEASAAATYKTGDIIEFGSYPQSKVTDSTLKQQLDKIGKEWVSFNYYSGSGYWDDGQMTSKNYMKYADISLNGSTYRAVMFSDYRPNFTGMYSSESASYQYNNGYRKNQIYYFIYEPLKWRILDPYEGLLMCEHIIDSQAFSNFVIFDGNDYYNDQHKYASDWESSSLRNWLNNSFYNTAFTSNQAKKIKSTFVENLSPDSMIYNGSTTCDNVFLLSYYDMINKAYDFNSNWGHPDSHRIGDGTDYAKSQGLLVNSLGHSGWRLRSPSSSATSGLVDEAGRVISSYINLEDIYQGIRPAIKLDLDKLENDVPSDGMQITVNNTNLSYCVGENIHIFVSDYVNGVKKLPENLVVKVSDSNIVELSGIHNYTNIIAAILGLDSDLVGSKMLILKGKKEGRVAISITNSDTGEVRIIPLNITPRDSLESIRADKMQNYQYTATFFGHPVETDYFNAYIDGIYLADFEYKETKKNGESGWNFSMNLYNTNYCCGVLEVYDANGKLIKVKNIDKYESLTKGIFKTFKTGYTIIENAVEGDIFSFRSDIDATQTTIKDLFVPQDGYILITADITKSTSCAINNGLDVVFTAWGLATDLNSIIKGVTELKSEQINKIKDVAFSKLLLSEEYLKLGENFQKKFVKKAGKALTLNSINAFVTDVTLDVEEFLKSAGLSIDGLLKTALGTGVGIAEGLFEKAAGPYGLILKGMFTFQDVQDFLNEANSIANNMSSNGIFNCATPKIGYKSGILKKDAIAVDTQNKVPATTVLQTYKIIKGDTYVINLSTGDVGSNAFELYEIALVNNGEIIQPEGAVKVYIESPYRNAIVARQNEDGTWSIIQSTIKDKVLSFEVDHFCKFAVIDSSDSAHIVNSVSIDNITMNYKSLTTVKPKIDADNGVTYTVKYESSNPKVAAVDQNGKVYGAKKGSADIKVTVTDSAGNTVTDTCNVKVKYSFGQWLIVILLFGWIWY